MNTSQIKEIVKKSVSEAVISCGTQTVLATRAGITQGAIGKYLRGEAVPTGVTAINLSKAVNGELSPADFAPHIFGGVITKSGVQPDLKRGGALC